MSSLCSVILVGNAVVCLILLVITLPQMTDACSCALAHPQTSFCRADFVIKAKVRSRRILYQMQSRVQNGVNLMEKQPTYVRYNIRINKIFKEIPEFQNVTQHHLYTPAFGSMCNVDLKNDTKYLLQGQIMNGKAVTNLCNHAVEWSEISVQQRKGYNYLYEQQCDCQVKVCWTSKCQKKETTNDTCLWNYREDPSECYSKHSMCKRQDQNSSCEWTRRQMWRTCLEQTKRQRLQEP